jgi:hypothetical protein
MAMEYLNELATVVFLDMPDAEKDRLTKLFPGAVWTHGGPKEKEYEVVEIVIHQPHSTKTFEGWRSDTDVYGAIASRFNYYLLGIDKNRVIEIGKRKFFTDIHDFHNALKNEDYSVFNANQYLDMEPEFYVIPLG